MSVRSTLLVTKSAAKLSRLLGRGGGHALPGLIAERMDPHLARKLAAGLPKGVVLVTGTNGKTTTSKLLVAALERGGEKVLTNSTGSNLKRGVTSALIRAASLSGKLEATIAVFEVDEASLRQVAPELQPSHIVVLNLFRDQLDRYGELDTTAALIGEGISGTTAKLWLNADDPLVASLAKYAKGPENVSYFGIEGLPAGSATAHKTAVDSDRCPICQEKLVFSRIFYGHIGHYRCPNGDFARRQPNVAITGVETAGLDGARIEVAIDGKRTEMSFALPGTYNLYNALAATSLASALGVSAANIALTLKNTDAAFGRVEKIDIQGRTLCLLLVKNPAGFTQVMETFLLGRKHTHVMFAINDFDADGRDVSWLWDVPIEAIAAQADSVTTTGTRGADMALRLHYAGVESTSVVSLEKAVEHFIEGVPKGEIGYVLPTYTAMLNIRKVLSKNAQLQEV